MRNRKNKNNQKNVHEMNIVPFIDVMLVLLVIFMAVQPQITQGIDVKLPKTDNSKEVNQDKIKNIFILSINRKGEYYIEEQKGSSMVTETEFMLRLQKEKEKNSDVKIFIRADEEAFYKYVVHAMSKIKDIGFPDVGLITDTNAINQTNNEK